jgi:hypothetical protein
MLQEDVEAFLLEKEPMNMNNKLVLHSKKWNGVGL